MTLLVSRESSLVSFLAQQNVALPPLGVVDVGCSGGFHPVWRLWADRLSGLGIDIIEGEIERLAREESNPNVRYAAARIGGLAPTAGRTNYALHRSQAYLATTALVHREETDFLRLWRSAVSAANPPFDAGYSNIADRLADPFYAYYAERFSGRAKPRLSDRTASVDELVGEYGPARVDVLKIDTDGADFDALRGAVNSLGKCLAVEVEAQFHGPVSPDANVFGNIDTFLREQGFSLFDLVPVRYARSALPRGFVYDIPAQTLGGPLAFTDAFYVRDLARDKADGDDGQRATLALVLDLYGFEDAAAELILTTPGLFPGIDDMAVLDFLARKVHGPTATYRSTVEAFVADPIGFHRRPGGNGT